ncbi:winged helix-turn-helix transcriptional regulator [Massilia sp. CMS3.1]|uniref:winged helix-turn-helix transcriptional regulator n=1 Tax=Massilia sp. CMS3.1 TaxID=3373083 RepID=UPI003EE4D572
MASFEEPTFAAACATRPILDQLANKWSVMILSVLCERPQRFNVVRRRLEGITQKALTQALRRLERNGLVRRRVIADSPVAVEYSITSLGRSLQQSFQAVYQWAMDHCAELEKAQRDFDSRHLGETIDHEDEAG